MNLRESTPLDRDSIRPLHEDAFGDPEGPTVGQLACDLLADPTAHPLLSLVAESDEKIIGHVVFSSVKIDGEEELSTYILAPLGIASTWQRKGVGTKLVNRGLEVLEQRGAAIILVLGDPNYYQRFGFRAGHGISPPYELAYPEAWMALELRAGVLEKARGVARCASCLNARELW